MLHSGGAEPDQLTNHVLRDNPRLSRKPSKVAGMTGCSALFLFFKTAVTHL